MHDDIQYTCMKKDCIYAFLAYTSNHCEGFCMFFFACLGSKLFEILERTQIENQIANKQKWQQQKWNLIKTDKNDQNRMAFFNGF